jgi:MFS family permease
VSKKSGVIVGGGYAKYVLGVLLVVNIFNFIDRRLLSILAEEIKADLGISNAEIGFLYGTAFAVFFAVFGIPMGKLADVWVRKNVISLGMALWSLMSALSGTARSFLPLAGYRIGVGIGEASASPSAYPLLSDYFPPRIRATVHAIYACGIYIGIGLGLYLGGTIVDVWKDWYPDPSNAPFGIKPWQAAFLLMGIFGLMISILVWTLKEPHRGQSEDLHTPEHPHPFRETFNVLMSVIPPFTLYNLIIRGNKKALLINLMILGLISAVAYGLICMTGSVAQWIAFGIGVYATISWAQSLKIRDYPTYSMIFRCRTTICIALAFPCTIFVGEGIGFWLAPFLIREHGFEPAKVGLYFGTTVCIGGLIGTTIGGRVSDILKKRYCNARLYVILISYLLWIPLTLIVLFTRNSFVLFINMFFICIFMSMRLGPFIATINDLMLPRMRGTGTAFYFLLNGIIGTALGPYCIGLITDSFVARGTEFGDALRNAMIISLGMVVVIVISLILAMRYLPDDEVSRIDRARTAGEQNI